MNMSYSSGQSSFMLRWWKRNRQRKSHPCWINYLDKVGEYVDQEIENLPAEEQEAAVMKLAETADTLVDAIDKAYTVTEKACDSIIDSLDELEKWIDKW